MSDVAERVSIAHRHLLASVRADPEWGWLLVRLDVDHQVLDAALGSAAGADLQEGLDNGSFSVANPRLALRASGGALHGVVQGVLRDEFGPDEDYAHAEGVLRSFGVPARRGRGDRASAAPPMAA